METKFQLEEYQERVNLLEAEITRLTAVVEQYRDGLLAMKDDVDNWGTCTAYVIQYIDKVLAMKDNKCVP